MSRKALGNVGFTNNNNLVRSIGQVSLQSKEEGDEWKIGPRYHFVKKIGQGGYGKVCKAMDSQDANNLVAIKCMKVSFDKKNSKCAFREMRILRHLRHPHIVELRDVLAAGINEAYIKDFLAKEEASRLQAQQSIKSPVRFKIPPSLDELYLVLEFVDTDLEGVINSKEQLSLDHVSFLLYQMLDGIAFLHGMHVIHRDLKTENILVNKKNCDLKIADFGFARVVGEDVIAGASGSNDTGRTTPMEIDDEREQALSEETAAASWQAANATTSVFTNLEGSQSLPLPSPVPLRHSLTKHVATRWYRAPEVILLQPYTTAMDIWSVGCIFAELLELTRSDIPHDREAILLFRGIDHGALSDHDFVNPNRNYTKSEVCKFFLKNTENLEIIFDLIGMPSDDDLLSLDACTAGLLRRLAANRKNRSGLETNTTELSSLSRRFSHVGSTEAVNLLSSMLHFDPRRRITAAQALEDPFFDNIKKLAWFREYQAKRAARIESLGVAPNPTPMDLSEAEERESMDKLKSSVVKEIMIYRKRDIERAKTV